MNRSHTGPCAVARALALGSLLTLAGAAAPAGVDLPGVRRVLDERCVACHACYNAPCQLDLASWAGLARGATGRRVYEGTRIVPAEPTRLFVDAHGAAEWQGKKGFFSVLAPFGGETPAFSLMGRMLALKRLHPDRRVGEDHDWMCPSGRTTFGFYAALGHDGMPHGFPALDDVEHATLVRWLDAGAALPRDEPPPVEPAARRVLDAWERLLNDPAPRARLVARYLYEHLFLARLYVEEAPGPFFRLVRSSTPAPHAPAEIATVRPYDDPRVDRVHYRFVPVLGTPVHKTHIVFPLSEARLARYREWFLGTPWRDADPAWPGHEPRRAANPFATFAAIPVAARYRFFLDNARYFVMSFIRGPVCEGQMAVNVINDHFRVLFLDPSHDLSVTDPGFLAESGDLLALPAAGGNDPFESHYFAYKERQRAYTAYREKRYAQAFPDGFGLEAIWDGGGSDPDAMLTVFRHFDNAAVVHGERGGTPKTAWVIDYPVFERIYYLLVAGFDVYGNAFHQAATRLYMDNLRVESEDQFLALLPPAARRGLRESWYRGDLARLKMDELNPLRGAGRPTRVRFESGDPKGELLARVGERLGAAALRPEPRLNVPAERSGPPPATVVDRAGAERWLNRLTLRRGPFVAALPDLAYLLVDFDDGPGLYALIRNKEHLNVAFALAEDYRRVPEEDTVSVLSGVAGSYPNFLLRMRAAEVPGFVSLLERWTGGPDDRDALYRSYGVSRYRADFWPHFDALNRAVIASEGVAGARVDLGKYLYR